LWPGFFGLILLAWLALFAMQATTGAHEFSAIYGTGFWIELCRAGTGGTAFAPVFVMWTLMSAAMMAPTFAPTLKTYHDLTFTNAAQNWGFWALLLGFLLIWAGFSALAALLQLQLANAGFLSADGASVSLGLTSALLALAGVYQLSALKGACLSKCRAPLTYFFGHWQAGPVGALRMGLHLGLICLGCCWALMLLGFVGGTMNLMWMGVATVLMTLEKLPGPGRWLTWPMAILLLAGAVATGILAIVG